MGPFLFFSMSKAGFDEFCFSMESLWTGPRRVVWVRAVLREMCPSFPAHVAVLPPRDMVL